MGHVPLIKRSMYEEKHWGWYRVLDYAKTTTGQEVLTRRIGMSPGKNLFYERHYQRSEVWTIIQGEGEFAINDVIYAVKAGDVLNIPVGAKHAIRAQTHLEMIEVQIGDKLLEEDSYRVLMSWKEIEGQCIRARAPKFAIGVS